jgi:hypothetical protein
MGGSGGRRASPAVKIARQEPARVVGKKRIHADRVLARQVPTNDLLGQWQIIVSREPDAWFSTPPTIFHGWGVALSPRLPVLPQQRVHILPAAKEHSEQSDLLFKRRMFIGRRKSIGLDEELL